MEETQTLLEICWENEYGIRIFCLSVTLTNPLGGVQNWVIFVISQTFNDIFLTIWNSQLNNFGSAN